MSAEHILQAINAKTNIGGDLPIFSASLNNVRRVSSNPDSHAMELAQAVMKDANLSVKLLKLANSPYFNRGYGKIGSISRAIILLGFDTVKNLSLTLKLIESFQNDHPAVGLNKMVVRSYLTAGFVRDVAIKSGVKDAEESYICALIHNLGEIAVAYFLPEKFIEVIDWQKKKKVSWLQAQQNVLGVTFAEAGQALAGTWEFPTKIISTMRDYNPQIEGVVRNSLQLNHALSSFANQAIGSLYLDYEKPKANFRDLMSEISKVAGIKTEAVENCLNTSFTMSCELAKEYGLDRKLLQPIVLESKDESRDKVARTFAYYASSQLIGGQGVLGQPSGNNGLANLNGTVAETGGVQNQTPVADVSNNPLVQEQHKKPLPLLAKRGDPTIQLEIIQEITTLVSEGARLNRIFVKIMEGLNRGVGFDRVVLSLINPDRTAYFARLFAGEQAEKLKDCLSSPIDTKTDLFSKIIMEGNDLVVNDVREQEWLDIVKKEFYATSGATSFIVSALRSGQKPVGFFFADNAKAQLPISNEDRRGFLQFIAQARLAIQLCS